MQLLAYHSTLLKYTQYAKSSSYSSIESTQVYSSILNTNVRGDER